MVPVEILAFQENIILRARGSELLIHSAHVRKLQDLKKPRDFSQYFRAEALVNRPARKLFEAWLRKDHTLWPRLYKTVQTIPITEKSPPSQADGEGLPQAAESSNVAKEIALGSTEEDKSPKKQVESSKNVAIAESTAQEVPEEKKTQGKAKAEKVASEANSQSKKRTSKSKSEDSGTPADKESKKSPAAKKAPNPDSESTVKVSSKSKKTSADKNQDQKVSKETKGTKKG